MANIMTKQGTQDNVITYEHYCDVKADLANIPKSQITLGSTAIVLQDENNSMGIYIAGSDKQWHEIGLTGGANGGAVSVDFIHICSEEEYDSQTLEPTVELPEENIFYLVPSNESGNDLFTEWIYTNDEWEKFGSGVVGATGPKGDTGAQGPKGDTGAQGPKGDTGDSYVLTSTDKADIATLVLNQIPVATGVDF